MAERSRWVAYYLARHPGPGAGEQVGQVIALGTIEFAPDRKQGFCVAFADSTRLPHDAHRLPPADQMQDREAFPSGDGYATALPGGVVARWTHQMRTGDQEQRARRVAATLWRMIGPKGASCG